MIDGYTLIDSGDFRKLERFGTTVLDRPSSLCAWKRRRASEWQNADASFEPGDGWRFKAKPFQSRFEKIADVTLEIELMSNGQLGIFPEHASYLPMLGTELRAIADRLKRPARVLNLFAYSGLATVYCAKHTDSTVTHVDLAKRAIESAKANAEQNEVAPDRIRWIVEDALAFMAREGRKNSHYDVIIIDPPSFSRVSKNNTWTLEEKLPEMTELVLDILNPEAGAVFFTNHSSINTVDVTRNIALDRFADRGVDIRTESLALREEQTARLLPAGSLIVLTHSA